jgi:glutamine amidotransferase
MTIAVVDYGMGNLRSVAKALEHVSDGVPVVVTGDPAAIATADRVVFPGQGAMRDCMRELQSRNLRAAVLEAAASRPFLGICIGLQMLFDRSEEADTPGLSVLPGEVIRFPPEAMFDAAGSRLKVPHMGGSVLRLVKPCPLFHGLGDAPSVYFVHSYHAQADDPADVAAEADYPTPFPAAVWRDNLMACQFHPEKSQRIGLAMYANFASL